jgi:hypothetical protein
MKSERPIGLETKSTAGKKKSFEKRTHAFALKTMAQLCNEQSNYRKAEKYYRDALDIYRRVLGESSLVTRRAASDLAQISKTRI